MSKVAVVISELAQHASGASSALEPAALHERSKPLQANKWTVHEISSALSQAAHHQSWKRWVKQVKLDGRKRAYYYDPARGTPKLAPNGRIPRRVQRSKPAASPQLVNGAAEYKLEVSGPDVLVSTKLTRAEVSALLGAIFPGRG